MTGAGREPLQFRGYHAVVSGSGRENFSRQLQPRRQRRFSRALNFTRHSLEVCRVRHDCYALEILGCRSQHSWPADIDVFDQLFGGQPCLRGRGFKRVEVHHHEIDGSDAMFRGLFLVLCMSAPEEQPAVDFRVQGLHASAQHLGPAGEIGNVAHRDPRFAKELGGPTSREDLDFQCRQPLGKFHNSGLVKHADKRTLHRHVFLHKRKAQQCKRAAWIGKVQSAGHAQCSKSCGKLQERIFLEIRRRRRIEHRERAGASTRQDFTRAFSLTWPATISTTYSTSLQFFCFCSSFVFFSTNSLKLERDSLPVCSPANCLACRNASYNCSTFSASRSGSEQVMRNALDPPAAAATACSSASFFLRPASISLAAAPKCRWTFPSSFCAVRL